MCIRIVSIGMLVTTRCAVASGSNRREQITVCSQRLEVHETATS